jgi:hypothetical protein
MGVYLVSIDASEWFGEDPDEGGMAAVAAGLGAELTRRGLPPYTGIPEDGPRLSFEEKLSAPMTGFEALCRERLTRDERETLSGWSVLVPRDLDPEVRLPLGSAYTDTTVIAGAPRVLALAQRLAEAIGLPRETPREPLGLQLTSWYLDGAAGKLARERPGPWSEDLAAAFYVALFLRAAEHALRRNAPLTYI